MYGSCRMAIGVSPTYKAPTPSFLIGVGARVRIGLGLGLGLGSGLGLSVGFGLELTLTLTPTLTLTRTLPCGARPEDVREGAKHAARGRCGVGLHAQLEHLQLLG